MVRMSGYVGLFALILLLCGGCAAPSSQYQGAAGGASSLAIPRKKGQPVPLHVLPASFSDESRRNYGEYIAKLEKTGYGNAIWNELEDILYDTNYFELIMESPTNVQAIRDILSAKGEPPKLKLPDKVMTINTNFFVNSTEQLSMMKTARTQQYHATVYLRYYELDGSAVNAAVPATGDAVAGDLMTATRLATRNAAAKLLQRLSRRAPSNPVVSQR